jgi:hypothetical protein
VEQNFEHFLNVKIKSREREKQMTKMCAKYLTESVNIESLQEMTAIL